MVVRFVSQREDPRHAKLGPADLGVETHRKVQHVDPVLRVAKLHEAVRSKAAHDVGVLERGRVVELHKRSQAPEAATSPDCAAEYHSSSPVSNPAELDEFEAEDDDSLDPPHTLEYGAW